MIGLRTMTWIEARGSDPLRRFQKRPSEVEGEAAASEVLPMPQTLGER